MFCFTSPATLKMWIHGCWTGWQRRHIRKHRPLNCFMPSQSVLPLKVQDSSTMNLSYLIITCKCWWSLWSLVKPQEPNSSWRNCSMCQGLSTEFWPRPSVQSKAKTLMKKKSLASWRICYSTSSMEFLATTMISSWGLWKCCSFTIWIEALCSLNH